MANRSYLYLIKNGTSSKGLCESNYNIPLIFKVLVSANPQMVETRIFEINENTALQGQFKGGLEKLNLFFERLLKNPIINIEFQDKIKKIKDFLYIMQGDYFYLDSSEIYDMNEEDLQSQNEEIFEQLINIDKEIESFFVELGKMTKIYSEIKSKLPYKGLFAKRKNEKANEELKRINNELGYLLGLDYWGNPLYYDIQ